MWKVEISMRLLFLSVMKIQENLWQEDRKKKKRIKRQKMPKLKGFYDCIYFILLYF